MDPGRSATCNLDRRDRGRANSAQRYFEKDTRYRYACWGESVQEGGFRLIEAHRTDCRGEVQAGACLTDMPADKAPAAAIAMSSPWPSWPSTRSWPTFTGNSV